MKYYSTRGRAEALTAGEAILKGIATDGGLYVPEKIPKVENLPAFMELDYKELAFEIFKLYLTDYTHAGLRDCVDQAYSTFDTQEVAPLVKRGGKYFLELFHGRTFAFKDVALSILPHFQRLAAKDGDKRLILVATSGDTGKAALEGFTDVPGVNVIVFYPQEGVSPVQKRQMQTHRGGNTFVVGVQGNFDDTQTEVKQIFTDDEMKRIFSENKIRLSSANSINIGRFVPQIVYYFYAYAQLLRAKEIEPGEAVDFTVPTGNFGNILAGYYAKKMGLPIANLICTTNDNKVLYDFFTTGVYDKNREFFATISPSMDILVSSNLERLLYNICGSAQEISSLMASFSKTGRFEFNHSLEGMLSHFATEEETLNAIKTLYDETGYVIDTHTAVGVAAYSKLDENLSRVNVFVSTASPFKFAGDVCKALGYPGASKAEERLAELMDVSVPERIAELSKLPIIHERVCTRNQMKEAVREIMKV